MLVVFTITKINCLVTSLFYNSVWPFQLYICGIKFFGSTICLVSGIATKASWVLQSHLPYSRRHPSGQLFSNIISSLNSGLQTDRSMVLFAFFLNLGLYYI